MRRRPRQRECRKDVRTSIPLPRTPHDDRFAQACEARGVCARASRHAGGFNFAPSAWASCDGRLLPIKLGWKIECDLYQALFSLLGTTFGGDGKTNFAVPDLRGAVAPLKSLTFSNAAEYSTGEFPQRPPGA